MSRTWPQFLMRPQPQIGYLAPSQVPRLLNESSSTVSIHFEICTFPSLLRLVGIDWTSMNHSHHTRASHVTYTWKSHIVIVHILWLTYGSKASSRHPWISHVTHERVVSHISESQSCVSFFCHDAFICDMIYSCAPWLINSRTCFVIR